MPKDPCSELSKVITEMALNIGSRPDVKTLSDVVAVMQKDIPEISRDVLVASINEATTGYARAKDDLTTKLGALKREARRDARLRGAVAGLEQALSKGELPARTIRHSAEPSPEIAALAEKRDALLDAVRQSDPAIRERFETQITNLTDRLENGVFTLPEPRAERRLSPELQRLEFERDKLRREVRQRIDRLKPVTIWGRVSEPLNAIRSVMTSMDFSGWLRQGGFVTLSHPIRSAKALPEMFRAFASEEAAFRAAREIEARPNAPLYAKHGLFLSEVGPGGLNPQEEAFVSRLAGMIPGVRASERAYTTILNRLRADSFDAMVNTLGGDGLVTEKQADAIANFVNVATGRAALPHAWENAAQALNSVFFAPRWVASRFQLLLGQPMLRGDAATRKLFAGEYARYLGGVGVVLTLGALAGGRVETDPLSSDFGKIRFGNTRVDPMSGLAQVVTLLKRLAYGQTKDVDTGEIKREWASPIEPFLRSKLNPALGAAWDAREVFVGKQPPPGHGESYGEIAAGLVAPISFGEIYETMREQGLPRGAALAVLSLFGMSASTYKKGEKKSHLRRDVEAAWEWITRRP